MCVYLSQRVGVHGSGAVGVTEAVLPAAGAADGRVLRPPQRVVPAHRHGYGGRRASAALRAVEGRSHSLAPPQQQVPGAEVTRHRGRAPLHHRPVPVAVEVVGAAEGATEQTVGPLPPVTVNRKYKDSKQEVERGRSHRKRLH